MSRRQDIEALIESRRAGVDALRDQAATIARIIDVIEAAFRAGGKLLTCGNGGSAAEAMHLSEELIGRYKRNRDPLAAVCLAADPTAMTCIANDFGYEEVFARQVRGLGRAGDVLVVLSTSGKSANLIRALEAAQTAGMQTIGLLGAAGSPAEGLCDIALTASVESSAIVQELHLTTIHLILEALDEAFA
ncbi:MAG: SIS domain-containing protein [Phycisphaerales bacterium]|nr:SIS domain-containing protein [Phycisphaerales bacterium]MCB9862643.1 SIS domain-containing protein [Phycisphaerales bacterium]